MIDVRRRRTPLDETLGPGPPPLLAVAIPALAALAGSVLILVQRSNVPISGDGARVLADRYPLTIDLLFIPLHFQLNALPILIWAFLDGPAPKLALLLALHVAVVTVTSALLVSRIGPGPGFAFALPLAVLGTASYDLISPWQIVFLLPLLFVIVATWLSVRRDERTLLRRSIVAACLILAVLSSNLGIVALFALGLWFVLERRWWQISELVPGAAVAAAWLLLYGPKRQLHIAYPSRFTIATPDVVPVYIGSGLSHGVGAWFGLAGRSATAAGLVVILAFVGYVVVRGVKVPPAFFAFFAAMFAMFAALSLIRSQADPRQGASARYVYLVLFMLAAGLGAAGWRLPESRWSVLATRMLVVVGVVAALLNLRLLLYAAGAPP